MAHSDDLVGPKMGMKGFESKFHSVSAFLCLFSVFASFELPDHVNGLLKRRLAVTPVFGVRESELRPGAVTSGAEVWVVARDGYNERILLRRRMCGESTSLIEVWRNFAGVGLALAGGWFLGKVGAS